MLFGQSKINSLSPRLRHAVLTLERKTKTDFIIEVPKGAKKETVAGKDVSTVVRIHERLQTGKPSKPKAELSKVAQEVCDLKADWYSYNAGVFSTDVEATKPSESAGPLKSNKKGK